MAFHILLPAADDAQSPIGAFFLTLAMLVSKQEAREQFLNGFSSPQEKFMPC
jgi:hypothetical protein